MRDRHKDQRRGHHLHRPFAAVGNSPAAAVAAVLRSGSSCSAVVGRTGPEADRIDLEAVHSPVLAAAGRDWACRCSSLGCRLPGCCSSLGAAFGPDRGSDHVVAGTKAAACLGRLVRPTMVSVRLRKGV
jgi:hypothetical protein